MEPVLTNLKSLTIILIGCFLIINTDFIEESDKQKVITRRKNLDVI